MSREFDDDDRIRSSPPQRGPAPLRRPRRDDVGAPAPRPPASSAAKTVLIVLGIVALVGCCVVAVPAGFFAYFGYKGISAAADKQRTMNNYKLIGLGMHNYASANDT